jgi:hypothetical protein
MIESLLVSAAQPLPLLAMKIAEPVAKWLPEMT